MKVLITGGAGFIGHHVVGHLLRHTGWDLTLIDRLDTSGNLNRLKEIGLPNPRVRFVFHDLRAEINSLLAEQLGTFDYIVHMAASTHVDRSIDNPMEFVQNNVVATCNLLDYARKTDCTKFLYFSTDEVFGPAAPGVFHKEDDPYRSGNPYAATKAGSEELCMAYENTYKMPILISHTMNVFGERQHPEKFIPMTIGRVLRQEKVLIHANPARTAAGSRFYVHALDVADAIHNLLNWGVSGQKYNIVGEREIDNLTLAELIAHTVGQPLIYELVDFHSSRPGHDLRYALDGSKMAALGWRPQPTGERMKQTVEWTLQNRQWLGGKS